MTLFDRDKKPLKIDKPIRLIELFAGIGSQAKALKRLGADFEHYRICEFDKFAIKSYNAVHGTSFEISDVTQITADDLGVTDTDKYCYMLTYSFPCQDLSVAGKGKGMARGSDTRSGLLWEVERLLNECTELPQILLMENVAQVHGKKNKEHFDEWIAFLESKGYSNYWKDLNAKNFGIPQNRNRTFMVSVLGDYTYEFPEEFPLELRLKDMLEDSVDEKFYLSDAMIKFFTENTKRQQEKGNGFRFQPTDGSGIGKAVTTRAGGRMDDNFIQIDPVRLGGIFDTPKGKHQAGSIWDKETIAPTVDTMQGGYRQPLVVDEPLPCSTRGKQVASAIRATIHKQGSRNLIQNIENGLGYEGIIEPQNHRIRKLTPKECWRLMGFDDADFEKAEAVNSNSQLYKQAGNSIVVDVLYYIFKQML